ncbi:LamG-like jellyroll fold domain-containing protein [Aquisphaera insulae]|uniref:LamG-like jellyroll fold domain-containing protein n=1 Tax=Aquisphaera insulae TaxID=2712864 RepID=UPI0013E9E41E|nr:LamG-like jellyroll fold domain-containing protein [Aquisphaera insulae]
MPYADRFHRGEAARRWAVSGLSCAILAVLSAARSRAEAPSPRDVLATATARWDMASGASASKPAPALELRGAVELGETLAGEDREASIRHGGDGRIATFRGGYLVAAGDNAAFPRIDGKFMTLCIRLRDPSGKWDAPVLGRLAPDEADTDLLRGDDARGLALGERERARLKEGRALTYTWRTAPGRDHVREGIYQTTEKFRLDLPTYREGVLRISAPFDLAGPRDWHDVIVRFRDANLELFVDGVLVDEEWPHGSLRDLKGPLLVGAAKKGGTLVSGFQGQVDHVALWDRALTDAEVTALSGGAAAVAARDREILGPEQETVQYWRPRGYNAYVGDCMPFFHDGTFHFYYLFDRRHHNSKWMMGAHQFGHASTRDLVHWDLHPLALPITEQVEPSLGTGLCVFHDGTYHMYYIPHYRRGYFRDSPFQGDDVRVATSKDGIHFAKRPGPAVPFEYPTGGDVNPNVFPASDPSRYFLTVGGKFFASSNLLDWKPTAELTTREIPDWSCATEFEWNGWHYYTAWQDVRKTRGPVEKPGWQNARNLGDHLFCPQVAPFTGNRRLLVGFVDDGAYGSDAVIRELVQLPDGDLGTRWVEEMIPAAGAPVPCRVEGYPGKDDRSDSTGIVKDRAAKLSALPRNVRLSATMRPDAGVRSYGLVVRSAGGRDNGMEIRFVPAEGLVRFEPLGVTIPKPMLRDGHRERGGLEDLARGMKLELLLKDDLLDVCVDGRRTFIVRVPPRGETIHVFSEGGSLAVNDLTVRPLSGR